jgi:hypothetical protein
MPSVAISSKRPRTFALITTEEEAELEQIAYDQFLEEVELIGYESGQEEEEEEEGEEEERGITSTQKLLNNASSTQGMRYRHTDKLQRKITDVARAANLLNTQITESTQSQSQEL